jgi:hypothetical protein
MNILYAMHLPWDWIKQRPHFLAEELSLRCSVEVVYRFYRVPFEGKLVRNVCRHSLKLRSLVILPFNRFAPVAALNGLLLRGYLRRSIHQYDVVWFTHPEMFEAIGPIVPASARVVYDCMDNHCAFDLARHNPALDRRLRKNEQALLERCDTIIASSGELRDMLVTRYGVKRPVHVVNNGIHLEEEISLPPLAPEVEEALAGASFRLTFVGTVASWLDGELLLAALERFPDLTVFLFGPREVTVPEHPRLRQMGPVPHDQIFTVMDRSDALIMPFRVTELVRGVDPVKLYEYVYSGKPALAVEYPETRKFGDFVHLYREGEELMTLLQKLLSGTLAPKRTLRECRNFALANTWKHRADVVARLLGEAGGDD